MGKILDGLEKNPSVAFLKTEYPDVWDGIETAVETVAANAQQEIAELSTEVKRQGQTQFFSALDRDVPNWEAISNSLEFREWLQKPHSLTGLSRYDLLTDAYGHLDAERAKAFFQGFLEETVSNTGRTERLVEKDTHQQSEVTRAEIEKYYRNVERGFYTGIPDAKRKEEERIERAIASGKVV